MEDAAPISRRIRRDLCKGQCLASGDVFRISTDEITAVISALPAAPLQGLPIKAPPPAFAHDLLSRPTGDSFSWPRRNIPAILYLASQSSTLLGVDSSPHQGIRGLFFAGGFLWATNQCRMSELKPRSQDVYLWFCVSSSCLNPSQLANTKCSAVVRLEGRYCWLSTPPAPAVSINVVKVATSRYIRRS